MKAIYLLLLYGVLQPSLTEESFTVYEVKNYDDYIFYYTEGATDTVVFIAHSDLIKSCKSSQKYINKAGLSEISQLAIKSGNLAFTYSMPTTSCIAKTVRVVSVQPGQENTEYIHTYSSYPYLIQSCSAFKSK